MKAPRSDRTTTGAAPADGAPRSADARAERLKQALKANMARRKAQQRARDARDTGSDSDPQHENE